ncbi:MAG TPA: hypothetical protein VHC45_09585 [Gaiellaceae bacterium]|nr:hypothetical protein [Gaiellaceae bacterium]
MHSLLLPHSRAAEVLIEVGFARWHARWDCPVLRAQPEAFVQPAHDPGETRACTICALPEVGAAAP